MTTNIFKNFSNHSTFFAKTLHQQPLKAAFREDERKADTGNSSNVNTDADSGFAILTPFSTKNVRAYTPRGKYYELLASHLSDEEKIQSLKNLLECFPNILECLLKHPSDGFKMNVLHKLSDKCLNAAKDHLTDAPEARQLLAQILMARNNKANMANKITHKDIAAPPLLLKNSGFAPVA